MVLPLSAALVVVGPVAGMLADRFGPLLPTAAGMLLLTGGMIAFAQLSLGSSYLDLGMILVLTGVGIALSISPITATVMNAALSSERGRASGFFNLLRFVGAVVGSTILSVILTGRSAAALPGIGASSVHLAHLLALMQGFHDAYLTAAVIAFAGFVASLWLRRGQGASEGVHVGRIENGPKELTAS